MTDEIFGPILPIVTVQSLDEAIDFVNSRPKPLAAYLFTKSKGVRERVIKEVSSGGMLVNHLLFQFSTTKLPFGGVGPSGMGAYHGRFGFEEFSHRKSVLTKPTRPDLTRHDLPAVYREGVEAGAQALLESMLDHRSSLDEKERHARSAGSRHRRHRSRWWARVVSTP